MVGLLYSTEELEVYAALPLYIQWGCRDARGVAVGVRLFKLTDSGRGDGENGGLYVVR